MEKYSIKVNILNRPYPLLVRSEDEQAVRNAAKMINEKIRLYKDNFSVKDDLDLVIMCCLELATDNINQLTFVKKTNKSANDAIQNISNLLSSAILTSEEDVPLNE